MNSKPPLTVEQLELKSSVENLKLLISSGTLTSSEILNIDNMITKKQKQLVCDIYFKTKKKKAFYRCTDGRFKSYAPQFIAKSEEELIEKLYDYYFSKTLSEIFKQWILRRNDLELVSKKTLEEDVGIWQRHISCSKLATMPIANIQPKDLFELFLKWTGNGFITYKEFSNRRTVLNGIFKFAVYQQIISLNPMSDLPYNELKFKKNPPKTKVYSIHERTKLLNYLETLEPDAYILAIKLSFYSILRIGEIKSLKWNSDDMNRIEIETQLVQHRTMNEDLSFNPREYIEQAPKGNPYFSVRSETINEKGVEVLQTMKKLNPNGKYLFLYQGNPLTTVTFNRRLKKYCEHLGIEYHSSHAIRFTSASICHSSGIKDTHIQPLLGHSTLRMTQHYLRQVESSTDEIQMHDVLC